MPEIVDAKTRVEDSVEAVLATERSGITRAEIELEDISPLHWLCAQSDHVQFYWSAREEPLILAGLAVADSIETEELEEAKTYILRKMAQAESDVRYFGSMRFVSGIASPEWGPFGSIRFVLPRIELRKDVDGCSLVVNILPDDSRSEIYNTLSAILWEYADTFPDLPAVTGRSDDPGKDEWHASVGEVLRQVREAQLEKVVLARKSTITFDADLDPVGLLGRIEHQTKSCFHILSRVGAEDGRTKTFVSATPERLFKTVGREVYSEAVAGTDFHSRSGNLSNGRDLLKSRKDRREQEYVVSAVQSGLEAHTVELDVPSGPSEFILSQGSHLRSLFKGVLEDGVTPFDLLRTLHPTPAVAGTPEQKAIDLIKEREPFDRGLYAGPIGWIGRHASEFAVAIRSGVVHDNKLHLYSGAGVVDGSDPADEWDEIEHKLADYKNVLGMHA